MPNQLQELTLLASGGGITPGLQLIRSILKDPEDKTKIKLLYFSENYDEILYREELDNYIKGENVFLTLSMVSDVKVIQTLQLANKH